MMLAARDENSDMDYDTRTWLNAVAGAGTAPRDLLKETGLSDWLQKELTASLATIGDILNGRSAARDVWLDMRPLKAAFSHPAMERWLSQVLERLPDCTPGQSEAWAQVLRGEDPDDRLPPCRPGTGEAIAAALVIRERITRDIPDQVNLMENSEFPRGRFNLAKTVTSFTYLLFLIPAAFIALGALIAARSKSAFLPLERRHDHGRRRTGPGPLLPGQGGHPLGDAHRPGLPIRPLEPLAGYFRRPCQRPGPGGLPPFHVAGDRRGRDRLRGGTAAVRLFLHLHPREAARSEDPGRQRTAPASRAESIGCIHSPGIPIICP